MRRRSSIDENSNNAETVDKSAEFAPCARRDIRWHRIDAYGDRFVIEVSEYSSSVERDQQIDTRSLITAVQLLLSNGTQIETVNRGEDNQMTSLATRRKSNDRRTEEETYSSSGWATTTRKFLLV